MRPSAGVNPARSLPHWTSLSGPRQTDGPGSATLSYKVIVAPPPLQPHRMILVIPLCLLRNCTPALTSRGIVSNRTAASLLSDLGFMHSTANPRLDSSVQASAFMKFD